MCRITSAILLNFILEAAIFRERVAPKVEGYFIKFL